MELSFRFNVNTTFYNRAYNKNAVDGKTLEIQLIVETSETFDLGELKEVGVEMRGFLNNAAIIRVDDPILIKYIEPKAGNTVHNFLNQLTQKLQGTTSSEMLGYTVPPETVNGFHVVVFGDGLTVTLEGLAEAILRRYKQVTRVRIDDGTLRASVSRSDFQS